MAGPLGVTQILLFSRNPDSGATTLRIARCPRGPTLHFRVKKYSLCKDIQRSMKRPKTPTKEFFNPPLLVMNNFSTPLPQDHPPGQPYKMPPHEALIISMFQSLFPALSAQHTSIDSIRRVLLLNRIPKASAVSLPPDERSESDYLIDLRHYTIATKPLGTSKAIQRLKTAERLVSKSSSPIPRRGKGTVPNLGKLEDISDYMLDPSAAASGYTSESEVEDGAEVEVLPNSSRAKNPTKRKRISTSTAEKCAVKLTEIGPRMTLELVKIEEGLADGKILYHSFVTKTRKEERELEERWRERKKVKEQRRKEQEENIRRRMEAMVNKEAETGEERQQEDDNGIIDYVKTEDEDSEGESNRNRKEESSDEDMWSDDDEMDVDDDDEEEI